MEIGAAVQAMRDGKRVRRAGWNGKGMWLVLVPGGTCSAERLEGLRVVPEFKHVPAGPLKVDPHVAMWTAQGTFLPGWLCSQTDLLATDWELVED